MKKTTTLGLAATAILLSVSLAGCSSSTDNAGTPGENVEQLKTEISKLQEENKQLKDENDKLKEETAAEGTSVQTETAEAAPSGTGSETNSGEQQTAMLKGQPVVIDGIAEYTVTKTSFAKKVIPSSPGDFYTYYEAKEPGTTYLAITLKVKNLAGAGKSADEFADMKVMYDNQYEYNTFSTLEENGGQDFTYTNISTIEPLKYGTLVYLAEVPVEVQTGEKPVYADIQIEGQTYRYTVR
ncbi:bZIP transcription factor [Paenibacillus albidus]|uniref:bZIP transcription factor n=1 Tax=Paenibacillus albidus TaxID=2041023 RepID=UPI001BE886CB|nr:bZIP transcription factor [Paenibacillus albidus]MBT2289006.1 bZIP transcription factor [Paenibacillus albidus]